jgi:hypothetical protein
VVGTGGHPRPNPLGQPNSINEIADLRPHADQVAVRQPQPGAVAGVLYFALGGAIENNAGTWEFGDNTPSTAILTDCKFLGNLAQAGALADSNGGALMSEGTGTRMTLTDCLISGNRSVGGEGGNNQGIGGGVMNIGIMTIAGCTITDNQAVGGDNAIISPSQPHAGAGFGGGVSNNGGLLNVTSSVISGNIARGGASASGLASDAFGGGLNNSSRGTLTVTDTLVSKNRAIAGSGGGGLINGILAGFASGGGIDTSFNSGGTRNPFSTTTLVSCTITQNVAQGSAGSSGTPGGNGLGGGLGLGHTALWSGFTDTSRLTVIDCTVAHNQAVGGAGGAGANGGDGLGGGLAIVTGSSATLTASSVEHNDALGGEEGHGGNDGQGVGGGVYVFAGGTFNFDATDIFKKNHASTSNDDIFP